MSHKHTYIYKWLLARGVMETEFNLSIKMDKGDCRYCGNTCEGEHGFSDEKGFIDICDDCLNDKLAKEELLK